MMNIEEIYELIQDQFDPLDEQLGRRGQRRMAIADLPQLARDLYLVHDVVAITCNAGTGAWIHYHHDEPGWIECAREAFIRIGHPQVSEGMQKCLAIYLVKGDDMSSEDDRDPSRYIFKHEETIIRDLYAYLIARGFSFDP